MKIKDEEKEQKIKEATLSLVAKEGIAGVKISRVAKRANLSPSMIYTYFKNKEDLLTQIFRDCIRSITQTLLAKRKTGLPYKARLFKDFENIMALKLSKSDVYMFFNNFMQSPFFKKEHNELVLEEGGKYMLQLFIEGQTQMIIKEDTDPILMLALFHGFSEKLVEMHINQRIQINEKITRSAFSLIWDGMRS